MSLLGCPEGYLGSMDEISPLSRPVATGEINPRIPNGSRVDHEPSRTPDRSHPCGNTFFSSRFKVNPSLGMANHPWSLTWFPRKVTVPGPTLREESHHFFKGHVSSCQDGWVWPIKQIPLKRKAPWSLAADDANEMDFMLFENTSISQIFVEENQEKQSHVDKFFGKPGGGSDFNSQYKEIPNLETQAPSRQM